MTNILILPEESDSYRALAGDKESTGRTPGQALDALRSQLTDAETGTLVIVQGYKPDRFFDAARQERLAELMRLRDAGELTAEDEGELESLIETELRAATARAESMSDVARQESYYPSVPKNSYIELVAQQCLMYAENIRRMVVARTQNYALAEDIVASAIQRVIQHAMSHGPGKEIKNVKAYLKVTASHLLQDRETGKSWADMVNVSLDDPQVADVANKQVGEQSAQKIINRLEIEETINAALADASNSQRELFHLFYGYGLTVGEVAARLGVSEATVKYRLKILRLVLLASMKQHVDR